MIDRRYTAMRHAVELALSGRCNNWWSISARLRARRYQETDVSWTQSQRDWLDQLCAEVRRAALPPTEPSRRSPAPHLVHPEHRRQRVELRVASGGARARPSDDGPASRPAPA